MSTDIVAARPMSVPVGQEVDHLARIASNIHAAGIYTKTAKTPQAVFAMLLAARDLGIAPTSALAGGIHMVDGKPEVSANLQAQLLREYRGPEGQRYDFKVLTAPRERSKECHLLFRRRELGEPWEEIGEEVFTMEDAQRAKLAGKDVWTKYPKMMLLARCLSDGIASHCPETARGLRVYGEGEVGGQEPQAPLEVEAAPEPPSPEPEPEPIDAEIVHEADEAPAIDAERAEAISASIHEAMERGLLNAHGLVGLIQSSGATPAKIDKQAIAALTIRQAPLVEEALLDILRSVTL